MTYSGLVWKCLNQLLCRVFNSKPCGTGKAVTAGMSWCLNRYIFGGVLRGVSGRVHRFVHTQSCESVCTCTYACEESTSCFGPKGSKHVEQDCMVEGEEVKESWMQAVSLIFLQKIVTIFSLFYTDSEWEFFTHFKIKKLYFMPSMLITWLK